MPDPDITMRLPWDELLAGCRAAIRNGALLEHEYLLLSELLQRCERVPDVGEIDAAWEYLKEVADRLEDRRPDGPPLGLLSAHRLVWLIGMSLKGYR